MITNDPFKTKEESLKTLLSTNMNGRSLAAFISDLNEDINDRDIYNYFLALYKKFPNEFKVSGDNIITLWFMNKEVVAICPYTKGIDFESFFEKWLHVINNIEFEGLSINYDYY